MFTVTTENNVLSESDLSLLLQLLSKNATVSFFPSRQGGEVDIGVEIIKSERSRKKEKGPSLDSDIIEYWNGMNTLPKVRSLSSTRKKKISARSKMEFLRTLDDWKRLIDTVASSKFLTGENDRNWRADFDWVLNENNAVKIYEGKYTNQQNGTKQIKLAKPAHLLDADKAADQFLERVR